MRASELVSESGCGNGLIYGAGEQLECFNPLDNGTRVLGPFPVPSSEQLALVALSDRRLLAVSSRGAMQAFDVLTRTWSPCSPALDIAHLAFFRACELNGSICVFAAQRFMPHMLCFSCALMSTDGATWQTRIVSEVVFQPIVAALE